MLDDLKQKAKDFNTFTGASEEEYETTRQAVYTPMFSCPLEYIETIQNYRNIQGQYGNWNYDHYMLGMFNGIEMCLAVLEEREPEFRTKEDMVFAFDKNGDIPGLTRPTTTTGVNEQVPLFDADYSPTLQDISLEEYIDQMPANQEE